MVYGYGTELISANKINSGTPVEDRPALYCYVYLNRPLPLHPLLEIIQHNFLVLFLLCLGKRAGN
jgi:hypothetical protein